MQNSNKVTSCQYLSDQITTGVWFDDKEQLVDSPILLSRSKPAKQSANGLKLSQKSFSDEFQKLEPLKQSKPRFLTLQTGLLCLLLVILVLLLSFAFFQKDLLRYIMSRLTPPKIQIHEETQPSPTLIERPKCKDDKKMFRVYYNPSDKEMKKVGELITEADECDLPVLGFWDLEEMNEKWNIRYPNEQIDLSDIEEDWQRQQLLVLQKLYFDGGIYINITTPIWKISNRSLKYALTGLDPIYADFSEKTDKGVYIPDARKFMRVRAPYSPVIREMIMKLARNEDYLDMCRERQCLIVR